MTNPSVSELFAAMDYGPAPESAQAARGWLAGLASPVGHFIGGHMVPAQAGAATFVTRNPASGEALATFVNASATDVDAAVQAAQAAAPGWARASEHQRARLLYALARQIQKHSRVLAVLESLDNGKPIRESRDIDVPLAARHFTHHAGWAQLLEQHFPGHQPYGVAGQIIPWNFPLLMLAWKIAPALATGNVVVLKPADFTPLTALYFAGLCAEVGVPPGVVNIVFGDGQAGEALVDHPGVAKLAFTGSTRVGRLIRERTAGSGKALTLELGGKSPFIVFEDADLDAAVEGVVDAIWFNQGEVCCAGSRLLVQEGVADDFLARLKARMGHLRVGDPLDKTTDIGAIVDPRQRTRIAALVDQAVAQGAGLYQPAVAMPQGCFYPPTLLTDVATSNIAMQEEIFGPVMAACTFRTQDEAVALANNSRYGLAASIWSEQLARAVDVARALAAGIVWVNGTNMFDAAAPFGGVRESGFGREGGRDGLLAYLQPRQDWLDQMAVLPRPVPEAQPGAPGEDIDRTPKFYIGGKQVRPDSGVTRAVAGPDGQLLGRVGEGNRKDVRNAVEAARKAEGWAAMSGHSRAQVIYYLAENMQDRAAGLSALLCAATGQSRAAARRQVAQSLSRLFSAAAWADKYAGHVTDPPERALALALRVPLGVLGIVCPEDAPLLALVSLLAPALAMGNRIVLVPPQNAALLGGPLVQLLETSDIPAGTVNVVAGDAAALALELARHNDVDGLWVHADAQTCAAVEAASTGNMKQTWVSHGRARDWSSAQTGEGEAFLLRATQVKTLWLPYGA